MTEGKVFYLTKEKFKELQKEYENLVAFERNKTIGVEAPKIFESEDMNPEFISYHEDMDSLRLKIDELNNILKNHQIIKNPPKNEQDSIGVGATILVDVNGKKEEFTVVGTLEANPDLGKISNESPVGMALLGRKVGQEIVIDAPTKKVYKIKNIKYEIT